MPKVLGWQTAMDVGNKAFSVHPRQFCLHSHWRSPIIS
ncbi:hypothetical protein D082_01990 [Synechocystis sp. PCC 6714]|nr:hypothetical protein D082_01990 [Synechocystis sp. PCC 6714]